jgi:hypothetical protein
VTWFGSVVVSFLQKKKKKNKQTNTQIYILCDYKIERHVFLFLVKTKKRTQSEGKKNNSFFFIWLDFH